LRVDSPLNSNSDLFLGTARVHRSWSLCERVLDPVALDEGDPGVVIIQDLSQMEQYANRTYVKDGPKFRFYAGVPIKNQDSSIVGSLCILDGHDAPGRTSVSSDERLYLQDLASTVMEYLDTYSLKDQHRRQAEGLNGLISFAEADMSTQSFDEESHSTQLSSKTGTVSTDGGEEDSFEVPEQNTSTQSEVAQPQASPLRRASPQSSDSVSDLQDMVLPNTTKKLFSRAADIIRKSRDLDGIIFLDASGKFRMYGCPGDIH
jgi:hypothetical protein